MNLQEKNEIVKRIVDRLKNGGQISDIESELKDDGLKQFEIVKIIDAAKKKLWDQFKIEIENSLKSKSAKIDFEHNMINSEIAEDFNIRIVDHYSRLAKKNLVKFIDIGYGKKHILDELENRLVSKEILKKELVSIRKHSERKLSELELELPKANIFFILTIVGVFLKVVLAAASKVRGGGSVLSFVILILMIVAFFFAKRNRDKINGEKNIHERRLTGVEKLLLQW